jgi:hypothetical protein
MNLHVRPSMTRSRQFLFLANCITVACLFLLGCSSKRSITDGRTRENQQKIAEALLSMLHSPLTNEMDIRPDDPRIPQIIRSLQPVDIQIQLNDVVVLRQGRPTEYHLSYRRDDPKPWVLYVAGQGYDDHEELLRLPK